MRCLTTNIWTPESGVRDSSGGWLLSFLRLSSTSSKDRLYCFVLYGLPLLLLMLGGMSWFYQELTWLYWIVFGLSVASFFVVFLPFFIYSTFKARSSLLERILHVDFLFIAFLSFFLLHKIYRDQADAIFLIFFESLLFIWLLIKTWEAHRWQNLLRSRFQRTDFHWDDPSEQARAWRWAILFIGSIVLLNLSLLYSIGFVSSDFKPEKFILAFLVLSLPLTQWLTNRFLAEADHFNFRSQTWKNFLNLRKLKSLIFHQHGVLTETVSKIEEIWIDESEDFEEAEIEEALYLLSSKGKHPVCKLVVDRMKKNPKLLQVLEFEERPHLGILAELEGLDRQHIKAHLGTLSWQKILKHEVSEAGMQTIRAWRTNRYSFSLLSLNRSVVGAIAWKADIKKNLSSDIRRLRQSGYDACLISSQIYPAMDLETPVFKDSSFDLLPIERPVHLANWLEREPRAIIVRSFWDKKDPPDLPSIVIAKDSQSLSHYPLAFSSFDIQSISWLMNASKKYFKGLICSAGVSVLTAIIVAGSPHLYLSIGIFLSFTFITMLVGSRSFRFGDHAS